MTLGKRGMSAEVTLCECVLPAVGGGGACADCGMKEVLENMSGIDRVFLTSLRGTTVVCGERDDVPPPLLNKDGGIKP